MTAGPFTCSGTILGIADFDGDGTPDCVVTTPVVGMPEPAYSTFPVFLRGLGNNTYAQTGIVSQIVLFNNPVGTTADLSGDGIADLTVSSALLSPAVPNINLVYMKSHTDGTFTFGSEVSFSGSMGLPVSSTSTGPGDFNGDGKTDLLLAAWETGDDTQAAYWLLVSDKGSTDKSALFALGAHGNFKLANVPGDFNADGHLDVAGVLHFVTLAGTTNTQNVIIAYGAGDGTFATPVTVPGTSGATDVSVGDLNGDGKLDLDVTFQPATAPTPLYGDGAGNFSTTPP